MNSALKVPGQNHYSQHPNSTLNTSKQRIARKSNQNREVWTDFGARQKTPKAGNRSALRPTRFAAATDFTSPTVPVGREHVQRQGTVVRGMG